MNGQRSAPGQPVREGQWSHVAATADEQGVHLYVNGAVAANLAAHLPALNSAAAVGGDAPGGAGLNPFNGA
ncbi:LamG-like jellyroll fold domain-containing protein, partial [Salmonella enterica]|uniref:LamG-like jellyroll fold domain-containing protein n=1 Tax=Salmonella enterica TaxID=28901 RepID=UPI003D767100